ncbi:MAG: hypothetical protein WC796_05155 [Candidatus Pacearchaeota archaeon]|jgi:hypothetical protein
MDTREYTARAAENIRARRNDPQVIAGNIIANRLFRERASALEVAQARTAIKYDSMIYRG